MMLTWMAYVSLVGALLAGAGAVLERFSPWLAGRRRLLWLGVIGATLVFAAAAVVAPTRSRGGTAATPPLGESTTEESARPQVPAVHGAQRVNSAPTPDVITTRQSAPNPQLRHQGAGVDELLLLLWLAGTTLCVAVLMISAWRVARMRRTWRESVLAGVPVFVSHDVGPAVIGLVHHGIVVPAWVETLGVDEQRTVMTHEREHVRAGDPLLLWGATLLVAIMPWNVALWYALRRLRHAIEIDCDARVLRSRPDARAYCTLLLDVGERTLAGVAPVAALAEPATLLERRIEAMMAPLRVRRRGVFGSAAGALALVAAACFTPRPEVAPVARVSALVSELNSLLARDSVRQSLSAVDRAHIARALAAAADSLQPIDRAVARVRDSLEARSSSLSTRDSNRFEGGAKVVQLARDSFPQAFQARDDAVTVLTVFDSRYHALGNYIREFRLGEVFDVVPGVKDSVTGTRDVSYLISRIVPGWRPRLRMSGSQTESAIPHATFLWAVLLPGEMPPPPQDRAGGTFGSTSSNGPIGKVIAAGIADSVARSLYPATYSPHDGIPVVGLIFSPGGQLLRHGMHQASHDEVFIPNYDAEPSHGEFARDGDELLSLVFTGMPAHVGRWSTTAHRTYAAPALVWTILRGDTPLPSPREAGAKPAVVAGTVSHAHREARVTLAGSGADEQWIKVYSTQINGVEAGAIRGTVRDTLRVRLPSSMTIDLGPGGDVHFVSESARSFSLSARVAGWDVPLSQRGSHIVLEGSGAGVKAGK